MSNFSVGQLQMLNQISKNLDFISDKLVFLGVFSVNKLKNCLIMIR